MHKYMGVASRNPGGVSSWRSSSLLVLNQGIMRKKYNVPPYISACLTEIIQKNRLFQRKRPIYDLLCFFFFSREKILGVLGQEYPQRTPYLP